MTEVMEEDFVERVKEDVTKELVFEEEVSPYYRGYLEERLEK